ncbi:thrombospondin type 3 repeat-containing protein [Tenacibaculum tangerinum]|uniref:Thrombospondin type 3 repeat-containing protein n=1 Tax=Tenacibaculum tangerinum TaxID=3038772 RepID=A0ABY8L022_9FLAO|nr:thrombospondin type 3 repeat-containing protein [Tenacibaculum tangerinum]WGH74680.1 thrombospondin type 3 repeat-containing protein [Tenacibaculum tangerinum]
MSEINPSTGRTHKENVYKIQEQLSKQRAAQKVPGEADNAWVERGPDNVGGRTRAVIFDPNDATKETVFAGGVSGGLWKNTNISNSESKWVRVGIPENLAVSCIAVDPNDSKTFYVGTGESYVNGDVNGDGLWKSTDGGNSWAKVFGGVTGESFVDFNSRLTINSPIGLVGDYSALLSIAWGGGLETPVTGDLALVDDGKEPADNACEEIINTSEITGKIAVIRRGLCEYTSKAKKAQNAGAIAVIIVNNEAGNPVRINGSDSTIKIPVLMITKSLGESIINTLSSERVNVNLTKGEEGATGSYLVPGIQHINDVIVRNNGGISEVYVAAAESMHIAGLTASSLGGKSIGVYKSVDGTNFTKLNLPKTLGGNPYEPNNLELTSDNAIYLSTARSFTFGDGGGTILKSTDGENFNVVYSVVKGLRTEIATSPTNPDVVYVLVDINDSNTPVKILKTTDGFTTVAETALPDDADTGIPANDFTRGQTFFNLLLKVDPNDENTLYVGGIDLFKSIDGAKTWQQISKWSNNNLLSSLAVPLVHSDQHGLAFASSNKMVFGNDGGVYFSDNSGSAISARNNNYNTVQFYTLGVAPTTAFKGKEYFLAGAQDNGTQLIQEASEGINSSLKVAPGDGAASFFDTDGTDTYFITNYVYNQSIYLYNYATNQWVTINDENSANGDFINQEELDSNLNILYSNYSASITQGIRRYSNILVDGSVEKALLTNVLMNAEPSALKVSPHTTTSSTLFVGLKNGKLLKVENANVGVGTWSDITGADFVGSISDIEFGETENQIFVTMHNYGVKNVWYSNDGGLNWVNKEGDLPDIPVKAILQNPLSKNEVIIGTDLGVWKTNNFNTTSPNWSQSYNGMSNVPVLDLDLRDDNTVFAATYGRGVFSGKFTFDANGDEDGDGILNGVDNCPTTANPDQADVDNNGIGDVCQDTDEDGILDINDNCPTTSNPDQADADGNKIGDACQDTDGDGVMDNVDNCPNTANPDQADGNNDGVGDVCDTSYKNPDNISITTTSETCTDENDGKITVNVKQTFVSYTVTLKGASTEVSEQLTTASTTFSDLTPGTYEVCVKVNDRDDYIQCFEVTIAASSPVSLKVAKNNASKGYTINVTSGTAPYNVYLNGKWIDTYHTSTFDINVQGGGILEVKTAKECEGKFETIIDNIFLKKNPVSESIDLLVPNDTTLSIEITVYDVTGKMVIKDKMNTQGNELSIPFSQFKSGIYILKLGTEETTTFKIIK